MRKKFVIGEAPSRNLNYYGGYNTVTQNSAGDITFECVEKLIHIFVSNSSYGVDFIRKYTCRNTHGYYIGTLAI